MGQKQIDEINRTARVASAQLNRRVISNQIPRLQKTFARILPAARAKGEKFFYRQMEESGELERWNITGRNDFWKSLVYFTNPKRGEILLDHDERFNRWLRSQITAEAAPRVFKRDFLSVESEASILSVQARHAALRGNKPEALALLDRLRDATNEMIEILSSGD